MTQVPPTVTYELARERTDDDVDTCVEIIDHGGNAGEVCGRERPCRFHDE